MTTTIPTPENTPSKQDVVRRRLLIAAGAVAGIIVADLAYQHIKKRNDEKTLQLETLSAEPVTVIEPPKA